VVYLGGQSTDLAPLDKHNLWYSVIPVFSPHAYTQLPNTVLIVTLISNFGTFLLYMTTCIVAIVAFREHHTFNGFKHMFIPVFGLLANLGCMLFYLLGPIPAIGVAGMSYKEPYIALSLALLWAITGFIYFWMTSKAKGKEMILTAKPQTA
jgi:CDP-diglyceride synthetase